jgi:hypothetical protein
MRHNSEYLGNIPGIVRTFVNATVYPQHNDKKVEKKKKNTWGTQTLQTFIIFYFEFLKIKMQKKFFLTMTNLYNHHIAQVVY